MDDHYGMYFQDRKKGYFVFKDLTQNVEINLRIEGSSAIQNASNMNMGYNASSYDNYSQMASPKASMQSMKRSPTEELMIVNFFFGMSESDDSVIIFSRFIEQVRDGNSGSQSLLKT